MINQKEIYNIQKDIKAVQTGLKNKVDILANHGLVHHATVQLIENNRSRLDANDIAMTKKANDIDNNRLTGAKDVTGAINELDTHKMSASMGTSNNPFDSIYVGYSGKTNNLLNGITSLPNGMILQWGKASFNTEPGLIIRQKITFTLPFPTMCVNIQTTAETIYPDVQTSGSELSKTGFTGCLKRGDVSTTLMFWVAIGF